MFKVLPVYLYLRMITHDHKIIFVHIPKCAGRSICDIFNQRFDHYTAKYYELEFNRFWKEYTKITIVRNPYDRLVSLYIYIKQHRRHANESIAINIQDFRAWIKSNIAAFNGNFYDNETFSLVSEFPPIKEDCIRLNYNFSI